MDEHAGDFRQLGFVRFGIHARTVEPLLFAGEEDKADGAPGLEVELGEGAGGFEHGHRAGAIVGGAGAEVPGVEMPADDDDFVGQLAAGDFSDGVVDLDGLLAEGVGDLKLDLDRAALEQP